MNTTFPGVKRTSVTLIAEDFVKTRQSFEYTNVVTCGVELGMKGVARERFRVVIRRDSHEFQSYARVEVWRRDGWTLVHALHGEDERVADLPTCYVPQDQVAGAREQFGDLATMLLDIATAVTA